MKTRNYYTLMMLLCSAGAVFGGFMLIISFGTALPLRLLIWTLTLCYMLFAARYKKCLEDIERREKEERRSRHINNKYPENSYYNGIRRSV
ncbi:MAG: hypothetical protein LIO87_04665 [Eubacterium sp.]|nr:hypothetical protein [Eubacterium sp.]